ncbi:MAG: helix-turn-helix domain-containing protein [Rhodospirillaceae bacterium]
MTYRPSKTAEGQAQPVDLHVGARIREMRQALHMTQEELAAACGVTFQQIQKYERGFNRVSCSRLVEIAAALSVHPAWFFDGLDLPSATTPTPEEVLMARLSRLPPQAREDVGSLIDAALDLLGGAR